MSSSNPQSVSMMSDWNHLENEVTRPYNRTLQMCYFRAQIQHNNIECGDQHIHRSNNFKLCFCGQAFKIYRFHLPFFMRKQRKKKKTQIKIRFAVHLLFLTQYEMYSFSTGKNEFVVFALICWFSFIRFIYWRRSR